MTAPDPKPPAPPPTLNALRTLLKRGFIVAVALVLGGYGILVAVRLIAKLHL